MTKSSKDLINGRPRDNNRAGVLILPHPTNLYTAVRITHAVYVICMSMCNCLVYDYNVLLYKTLR